MVVLLFSLLLLLLVSAGVALAPHASQGFYSLNSSPTELLVALDHPVGLAVSREGAVYFTESGMGSGWLRKLDREGLTTLLSGLDGAAGVAVDEDGNVYFAEPSSGSVKKLNPKTLRVESIFEGLSSPWALAIHGKNLYVAQRSLPGSLVRINLEDKSMTILQDGLKMPSGVDVDAEGNIYFSEFGENGRGGSIKKIPATGTQTVMTLLKSDTGIYAVAVDGRDNLFYSERAGFIKALPLNGGKPAVVASGVGRVYGLDLGSDGSLFYVRFGGPYRAVDGSLWVLGNFSPPQSLRFKPELEQRFQNKIELIMSRIEEIRGLQFTREVPVEVIHRELVHLHKPLFQLSSYELELAEQEYKALHMIEGELNIREILRTFIITQLLAYYDTPSGKIVIIASEKEPAVDEPTLAHELAHALAHQRFPEAFRKYSRMTDDVHSILALIEGEARLVEEEYVRRCNSGFYANCEMGFFYGGSSSIPLGFLLVQAFPYLEGLRFAKHLTAKEGWQAINAAYRKPPQSAEQVIHPEKYGVEPPRRFITPNMATQGWGVLGRDILGEASIFAMFKASSPSASILLLPRTYNAEASEGWGGDEMVVYRKLEADNETASYGYVWRILWDSPEDAREFVESYVGLLKGLGATRVGDMWKLNESRYLYLHRQLYAVTIVGAPSRAAVEEIYPPLKLRPLTVSIEVKGEGKSGSFEAGQPVGITLNLENKAEQTHVAAIIRIEDSQGRLVSLKVVEANLETKATFTFNVAWVPEDSGQYTLNTIVWRDLDDPTPLAENVKYILSVAAGG